MNNSEIKDLCKDLRCDIIEMIGKAKSGHPGGSLSCIDILACLYFCNIMTREGDFRDRFILSKGHAAPALYATLAHAGYFGRTELFTLRKLGSILQGHPDMHKCPGVEVSTGSLGQGLSIACGEALGFKIQNTSETVFTILGDGECQEGQVWEAAMFASQYNLDNLIAIVDCNGLQIDGAIDDVMSIGNLRDKFESFGWQVYDLDGHNYDEICEVLASAKQDCSGRPKCVVAKTIKGRGVSFMENNPSWHGKAPNEEQVKSAISELKNCA